MKSSKRKRASDHKRLESLPDRVEAYQSPAEEDPPKKKPSNEKARQILVERLIQEAIDRGEFDNLAGAGKPLVLDKNPHQEPGQEWAFGLLKRNGFAPEWIERDKEIRRTLEESRERLQKAWQQRRGNPAGELKWRRAVSQFEESLNKTNRKIDDFNLIAPHISLHRSRLRLADELRQIASFGELE